MNADKTACASSGKTVTWEQIDWTQCERRVRRLQARIVKATQENRWGKLLIQPSKKNTHNFLEKVRQLIRQNRGLSQTDLIRQLNPIVRGWANYHRHVVAKGTFKKVEWALWHSLWRWARRRHSGKRSRWLIQRYWHPVGGRNRFAANTGKRTPGGKPLWLKLVNPTEISIRRHVKIRGEANPFDPRWRAYMEDRAFFRKFGIHRREAGLKPLSEPAPPSRGFEAA